MEGHPDVRHVFAARKSPDLPEMECLTCDKVNEYDEPCMSNSATFSKGGSYFVWTCQGSYAVPLITIVETKTKDVIHKWETNSALHEQLAGKALPTFKNLFVDVADGFQAQVRLILPHDFDETKKYPMLINT